MKTKSCVLAVIMGLLCLGAACSPKTSHLKRTDQVLPGQPQGLSAYLLRPGDQLDIKFFYNPELNESVIVRPDGKISLQLVDEVGAAGMAPAQLDEVLTAKYAKVLKKPAVTVIVRSFSTQQVYVGGEVNRPGLMTLNSGMTPLQAVFNAGGFRETAKTEGAILIRKGKDDRPIHMALDLNQALYGQGPGSALPLKPQDIVFVPKTWIAEANKFVNQYIENLLLYRGVSFGFSYRLDGWREDEDRIN